MNLSGAETTGVILSRLQRRPRARPLLVGLSGIDGSGKSRLAQAIVSSLRTGGTSAGLVAVDRWLTPAASTPSSAMTPREFLEQAIRFDGVFSEIDSRTESVVVVEGIFLFRRAFVSRFDLRLWINCSFEVAMERAIRRRQEGLDPAETRAAYETLYFPAQRLHFAEDDPAAAAHYVIDTQ